MSGTGERRRFTRLPFDARATCEGAGGTHEGHLVDVSLKGVLIHCPATAPVLEETCRVRIEVEDAAVAIEMEARVAHASGERVGLEWQRIDLDSLTALRRLLELNLGDPALVEREFEQLG